MHRSLQLRVQAGHTAGPPKGAGRTQSSQRNDLVAPIPSNPSNSSTEPQPAVNQLDLVLLKAAKRKKLTSFTGAVKEPPPEVSQPPSSSAGHRPKEQKQKPRISAPPKGLAKRREGGPGNGPADDDTLFDGLQEEDVERAWVDVTRAVRQAGPLDDDTDDDDDVVDDESASFTLVASSSGFKGFGAPPKAQSTGATEKQGTGNDSKALRAFLFAADEAKTREALQALGLESRVTVTNSLQGADLILATKFGRSGSHVNMSQGEKTAANAGIPFVVVGRSMSPANLEAALQPFLDPSAAGQDQQPSNKAPSEAQVRALKVQMLRGFGKQRFDGGR